MHTYSINSDERKNIPFGLAVISILIIFFIKDIPGLPSWAPIPSVFALYGILYRLFDKFLWKLEFLHDWGVVCTPDMNGKWKMLTQSSLNNYKTTYEGALTIRQTWTEIFIHFDGDKAFSISKMAGFEIHTAEKFSLKWEYLSQKKPAFSEEDYMHYGMTKVMNIEPCGEEFRGDYYTDRSRHNYGPVTLRAQKKA